LENTLYADDFFSATISEKCFRGNRRRKTSKIHPVRNSLLPNVFRVRSVGAISNGVHSRMALSAFPQLSRLGGITEEKQIYNDYYNISL